MSSHRVLARKAVTAPTTPKADAEGPRGVRKAATTSAVAAARKRAAAGSKHVLWSPNKALPHEVFSRQYLETMHVDPLLTVVPNPENDFNRGQDFEARSVFSSLVGAAAGDSPVSLEGLSSPERPLRVRRGNRGFVLRLANDESFSQLVARHPGLEPRPMGVLWPAWTRLMAFDVAATMSLLADGHRFLDITVLDQGGNPISDALIQVVYSAENKSGVEVVTNGQGLARLAVPQTRQTAELVAILPCHSYWPIGCRDVKLKNNMTFTMKPLGSVPTDTLRKFLRPGNALDGRGVSVAVVDGGIGPHDDIVVSGGSNLALGEDPLDATSIADNGLGHGTHVAGIIAGTGKRNSVYGGLAPGVALYSYRVLKRGDRKAPDVSVADAIVEAAENGCHLINVSLGNESQNNDVARAVIQARALGSVVIAAAGNGGRRPVEYPAAHSGVIAVSAVGHKSTLPADSVSMLAFLAPPHANRAGWLDAFFAAFSNVGPEIRLTAPGVGIISTYPGNNYAVNDGTSMATPVITGLAARALSRQRKLLASKPDQNRSDSITKLVLAAAQKFGFGAHYEGNGLPELQP